MFLSEISIKRPVLATMMSLGLVLFGIIGISRLPVRELPDVDPPIVTVTTIYTGASAGVIETQITEPLEDILNSVEGIKKMTSESREQVSTITIEFDLSRSVDLAAQDVRDRVSRVRGTLPDNIDEPIVAKQEADAQPSLWIALYSEQYSTLELSTLAENLLKDRLQTVPGVSSVIFGGQKRFAIRLWLDSEKMAARGVTVQDVDKALKSQNVELPSGRVESWQRELSIETLGEMKTPEEYNDLVIRQDGSTFIRLRDIGYAKVGVEDERSIARFNSKPCVGIGVIKQSKANTIDVARGIKAELERTKPLLPAGVNASIPYDESIYIEKSIVEVWETLGIAFFLVVLTIFIFLHNARSTFIPSITIPVSIISTFGILYLLGFSINIVTMLAFVLAIGLVVDDAIIVLENIYRHVEEGMEPKQAAFIGMNEIGFAVMATTIALVAVFLPMAFQTSITGRLFIEFAVAISCSVLISAFVALTLAPMISARVLRREENHTKKGLVGMFERTLTGVSNRYEKSLKWALKFPLAIIVISIVVLLLSLFFFSKLTREFLPDEDKGRLFCFVISPEGSTSEYTDRMVKKAEKIIQSFPEVEGYFSAVALARGAPGKTSQGLSFIRLKDGHRRHVRDIVGGPTGLGAQFFMTIEGAIVVPIIPKSIGGGFSQPFQLVLQSQDLEGLNKYAEELSGKLRGSGYLANVRSTFELNKPELRVFIDRNRAGALGVSVEDISRTLQILFGGLDLSKLNIDGKEYDVIVQLERESRLTPSDLDKLYIRSNDGKLVQLSNVVTYETGGGPSAINHYNRFRSATIEGTPVNVPLGTAVDRVKELLKTDLPAGFRYEWTGDAENLEDSGKETVFVLILSMIVIYMVLAAQFESLVHPLTVMLTVPLAAFGAFGALWALSLIDQMALVVPHGHWYSGFFPRIPAMGMNLYSQIGLILLIGLVTKNGILLVDFANQQVAKGKTPTEAMLASGMIRLRPILMTATATIAGILPIAIGFGAGAESRRPLGVAAVGGMLTSTFLTLFVIPVAYVLLSRIRFGKKKPDLKEPVKALTILLVAAIFFSGCTQGPNYKLPAMKLPVSWKTEDPTWKQAAPQDHIPKGEWWKIFQDPVLDDLEKDAIDHNQDIKQSFASLNQARAEARLSQAEFFPTAELNPEYTRERTSQSVVGFSTKNPHDSYSIPLDMSYELDIWGRVKKSFESSQAEAQASKADFHAVLLAVTADVARYYFMLRELEAEKEILDKTVDLRQSSLNLVDQRFQSGLVSELDLTRAQTELATAKANRIDIDRQMAEAENALAVLCGKPASEFNLSVKSLDIIPPVVPPGMPSNLLERRPDIAEAERLMASANADIGVAQAAFFPKVTLTGTAGFESLELRSLTNWESRAWSLGPNISIPIFQGGRNKANLEIAKAKYDQTVAFYRKTILVSFQEVEDSLAQIRLGRDQWEMQKQVMDAARRTAKISNERYKQGLVNYLEVTDAERSRLQSELEAIRILSHSLISTVQLIKALGGGWN